VHRVVRQTKARVFDGLTQFPGKLVSQFEPHTEIIRKGKAGKPIEFGKLVQLREAENQIITHYEVYEERPSDRHLLLPAVEAHRRKLGRAPRWVAADAGYYSRANEEGAHALGVKYVSVPNRRLHDPLPLRMRAGRAKARIGAGAPVSGAFRILEGGFGNDARDGEAREIDYLGYHEIHPNAHERIGIVRRQPHPLFQPIQGGHVGRVHRLVEIHLAKRHHDYLGRRFNHWCAHMKILPHPEGEDPIE
jgi:hypothetical protein